VLIEADVNEACGRRGRRWDREFPGPLPHRRLQEIAVDGRDGTAKGVERFLRPANPPPCLSEIEEGLFEPLRFRGALKGVENETGRLQERDSRVFETGLNGSRGKGLF